MVNGALSGLNEVMTFTIHDLPLPLMVSNGTSVVDWNMAASAMLGFDISDRPLVVEIRKGSPIDFGLAAQRQENSLGIFAFSTRRGEEKFIEVSRREVTVSSELLFMDTLIDRSECIRKHFFDRNFQMAVHEASIVSRTDGKGSIVYVNENFTRISGYPREELIGKSHNIINSGFHPRSFWQRMWKTISSGKTWRGEVKNRAKDGSYYWVDTFIMPFRDENGTLSQFLSIRNDITERKASEEQLERVMQTSRETLLFGRIGSAELEAKSGILNVTEELALLLGGKEAFKVSFEDFLRKFVVDSETGFARTQILGDNVLRRKSPAVTFYLQIVTTSGKILTTDCKVIRKKEKQLLIFEDVSERIEADRQILDKTRTIGAILESITDGFFLLDKDLTFVLVNPVFAALAKMKVSEMEGKKLLELFPFMEGSELLSIYSTALHDRKSFTVEHNATGASGPTVFRITGYPGTDGLFIYYQDITGSRITETRLQDSYRLLGRLSENVPGVLFSYCFTEENEPVFTFISAGAEKLLEVVPSDLLRESSVFFRRVHPGDAALVRESMQEAFRHQKAWSYEFRLLFEDGRVRWVKGASNPYEERNGEFICYGFLTDVTEEQVAREKISESELINRLIIENSGEGIFFCGPGGAIYSANPEAERIFGMESSELVAIGLRGLADESSPVADFIMTLQRDGFNKAELQMKRRDGSVFTAEVTSKVFISPDGKENTTTILRDVSARKRIEEVRQETVERFEKIAAHIPGFIFQLIRFHDGTATFPWASKGFSDIFEVSPDGVRKDGSTLLNKLHPEDLQYALATFRQCAASLSEWKNELRVIRSNGEVKWIEGQMSPVLLPDNSTLWSGYVTDITQRKLAEQSLLESEERFRLLYHHTPAMMHSVNRDGILLHVNDYWLQRMEYQEQEVIGKPLFDFLSPSSARIARELLLPEIFEKGTIHNYELQFCTRWGETLDTLVSATSQVDGILPGDRSFAVLTDVTAKKKLEKEVEKLAAIARHTSNLIIFTDSDGLIEWVNDGFERVSGYSREEVMGRRPGDFLQGPGTDPAAVARMSQAIRNGEGFRVDLLNYSKAGKPYWLDIEVMPLYNTEGKLTGFMAIELDISTLKEAMAEMQRSRKTLQAFMDHAPLKASIKDTSGRYTFFNKMFREARAHSQLVSGCTDYDLFDTKEAVARVRRDKQVMLSGAVNTAELALNDRKFFEIVFPLRDDHGVIFSVGRIAVDITDIRRAEEKVVESEKRLRSIADHLSEGVIFQAVSDIDAEQFKFLYISGKSLELFGFTPDEMISDPALVNSLVYEEDLELVKSSIREAERKLAPLDIEFRLVKKEGRIRWLQTRATPKKAANGKFLWDGIILNISARKKLELTVQANEAKLQSIFQSMVSGVVVVDVNGEITYANQSAADILSLEPEEIEHRYYSSGEWKQVDEDGNPLDPKELPLYTALTKKVPASAVEHGIVSQNGTTKWLHVNAAPLFDQQQQLIGAVASFLDITEQKNAQRELLKVYDELDAILNASTDSTFFMDKDFRIRVFNKTGAEVISRVYGKSVKRGDDMREYSAREALEAFTLNFGKALAGTPVVVEREIPFSDKVRVWTQVRYLPVYDRKGAIIGVSFNATDITQRKVVEQRLFESQQYFESLVHSQTNFLLRMDRMGRLTFANKQFYSTFSIEPDELIGRDLQRVLGVEDAGMLTGTLRECMDKPGEVVPVTLRSRPFKGGLVYWTEWEFVALCNERGEITSIQAVGSDSTERIRNQIELERANSRLLLATQAANLGVWEWNMKSGEIHWDEMLYDMAGYPRDRKVTFNTYKELVVPEDFQLLTRKMASLSEQQNSLDLTVRINRLSDGIIRYIKFFSVAEFDREGRLFKITGVKYDITEQEISNKLIRESEKRFRTMADTAPVFIWMSDVNNYTTFLSKAWYDFTGSSPAKELGKGWLKGIHPDDYNNAMTECGKAFSSRKFLNMEYRLRRKDGVYRWILDTGTPRYLENGEFVGYIGSCFDITERKEMEAALAEKTAFLEGVLSTIDIGILACDSNGELNLFNRAAIELNHLPSSSIPYREWKNYSILFSSEGDTEISDEDAPLRRALVHGEVRDEEFTIASVDGMYRHILSNGKQLKDSNGNITGAVLALQDITIRKHALAQLTRALREKELLIKEIHHRVKNNLQLISSILYVKTLSLENQQIKDFLEETRQKIRSIALIHERLLQTGSVNEIDIADYLGKLINDLSRSNLRQDLEIRFDVSIDSFKTSLDTAVYCGLIINELVTNSLKHAFRDRTSGNINISLRQKETGFELVVRDDGTPIPEGIAPGKTKSFGMQFLDIFTRQINGSITIDRAGGTGYSILFK